MQTEKKENTINNDDRMEKIVSLCKRRGFVFAGSEIYGGFAGTYDYGHYGVMLKDNIERAWKKSMDMHRNMSFINSSIFTASRVWEASGHVSGFSDPLVLCDECNSKNRADHLLESIGIKADEKISEIEINKLFDLHRDKIVCPNCGKKNFGKVRAKNLLATSNMGVFDTEGSDQQSYLRGETAQGIFINYKNILETGSHSIPFGIAQIGKAFRNEISPRQFLFRKREFEQMEMQYFCYPSEAMNEYENWKEERMEYYLKLGIPESKLHFKDHDNLVFYAKAATDIEYEFPFGWGEIEGIHYRSDYDLSQHQKFSGVDMTYFDEDTKERFVPHVVEVSSGLDRTLMMFLCEAYREDDIGGSGRVVLKLNNVLSPIIACISPLLKNKPILVEYAEKVFSNLKKEFGRIAWDDNGNIGKRYRRQDEIGTPFCIVIDFDTLGDPSNTGGQEKNTELKDTVTVRDRDTATQERVNVSELVEYLKNKLK